MALERAARRAELSKSEYLRQCLAARLQAERLQSSAYELGKDLFGGDSSGRKDLVKNAKRVVHEKVHAKAHRA